MKKHDTKANALRKKERRQRLSITLIFSVIVFTVLLSAIALAAVAVYLLDYFRIMSNIEDELKLGHVIFFMSAISIVLGSVLFFFTGKIPLRPIHELIHQLNRLSAGDFKARLKFHGVLCNHPVFSEIAESFNKMAEELENTELLRSDFINNFSHEFKTPIVSIAGFAKLLESGDLDAEQREQYLHAMREEAVRLSYLATNIFNLTKVENQTILSDVTKFNLSEQIRSAVLLFEGKWTEKKLDLLIDFEEYEVEANEELLKQVWINLMDNAVKFAPVYGTVSVDIKQTNDTLCVSIGNTGNDIPKEKINQIFRKFYQADESHSSQGNGIGLAIVKKIVDLHQGNIEVKSENGMTVFTVYLPII